MAEPLAHIKAHDEGTERVGADGDTHWELLTKRGWGRLELHSDRLVHVSREPREIALRDVVSVRTGGKHNSRAIWPRAFVLVRYRDAEGERVAGFRMFRNRTAEEWRTLVQEAIRAATG